jgi:zinc transport system substrate-binding protein
MQGREMKAKDNKRKLKSLQSAFCCVILVWAFAILGSTTGEASEPLTIYVVNYPLKYFAERIGGDHVEAVLPAPTDSDPAYWTPDIVTIGAYQQADLILLNGAGYAKWVAKTSLPYSKVVDTSKTFRGRYIQTKKIMTHSHGAKGKHAHESLAFTTWLDLELAARQAEAILAAMVRKRPELRKTFQTNYASLLKELKALDQDIQTIVSQNPSTPLIVSHPVYDYFAKRYGLNIVSVHWEPDQVPGDVQWGALRKILEQHPAKWMVWEGEPARASVAGLEQAGIKSVVFNPCGNIPEKGDFISMMRRNVENLRTAFSSP